jgi:FAD dependent oxidoreductase TIGR03364
MSARERIEADVCVVGAGIVGLAHAHEALARGASVVVLERNDRAVGASVRNFGHGVVTAMGDGEPLEFALAARERWLELGARVDLGAVPAGSLIVARHEDELEVLDGVASDPRRQARIVTADELGRIAPIPTDGLLGGLHAPLDIRVDPRRAVAALAELLERDSHGRVVWNAPVQAVEPGALSADGVTVSAPVIVLCPGPDYDTLPAGAGASRPGLTRCKLQMQRVASPGGARYRPALLTGLSLLRYPAFEAQPGFERVRARLAAERPELVDAGIHLIVTQLPDGDLIIGDTHEYGDAVSPFNDARLDALVLAEAARLLGAERLDVRERWHGVYPVLENEQFLVESPMAGVLLVEIVSGIGMTTAFGLARRVLDDALSDGRPATPRGAQPPTAAARAGYGS